MLNDDVRGVGVTTDAFGKDIQASREQGRVLIQTTGNLTNVPFLRHQSHNENPHIISYKFPSLNHRISSTCPDKRRGSS